ncbi:hypothetical protein BJ944DRAFT_264321 [Cunninghamella echinulata]|nr:hypothetical protein BJ944DRAFT_264321 [Cunninghamella echinulata]
MEFCQTEPVFNKVPLYQPDQLTFNSNQSSLVTTTENINNTNSKSNHTTTLDDSTSPSPSWTPPSYELQEMLVHYQSQPDLLQLILESKLQEDKRRTEEARLRAKELDLMLLQHQQLNQDSFTTSSLLSDVSNHNNMKKRRNSSLNNITENNDDLDDMMFLQQITSSFPNTNKNDTHEPLTPPYPINDIYHHDPLITTMPNTPTSSSSSSSISSPTSSNITQQQQRPRKRREMQAITKLVETKEFPYLDGYFWRNNGNTIQKKTGNKSVYYKCSNSSKNCTVNKTILFKENGEYLIKYRGEHLPECGKVQHIVDV